MKNSYLILIVAFAMIFPSCTKEDYCKNKALCDLLSNTLLPQAGVLIGVDLTIVSSVYNVASSSVECTQDAPSSQSNFDVLYREDSSSDWKVIQNASNNTIDVNPLVPNSKADKSEIKLNFNVPGQYKFMTMADHNLKVPERDEQNNDSCAGCLKLKSNNISTSKVLTVYSNPDIPHDPNKPAVIIVSVKKLVE